jgi:hypothetical protein
VARRTDVQGEAWQMLQGGMLRQARPTATVSSMAHGIWRSHNLLSRALRRVSLTPQAASGGPEVPVDRIDLPPSKPPQLARRDATVVVDQDRAEQDRDVVLQFGPHLALSRRSRRMALDAINHPMIETKVASDRFEAMPPCVVRSDTLVCYDRSNKIDNAFVAAFRKQRAIVGGFNEAQQRGSGRGVAERLLSDQLFGNLPSKRPQ